MTFIAYEIAYAWFMEFDNAWVNSLSTSADTCEQALFSCGAF
jgi:hypothetical protein